MPKTEVIVGTYNKGTVVEYEVTYKTHWVGIMGPGPKIIRCDNEAKETGYGVWSTYLSGQTSHVRSSWVGKVPASDNWTKRGGVIPFEDIIWIKSDKTWYDIYEKDYS